MLKAETLWLKQAQDEAFPKGEEEGSLSRFNTKKNDEGLLWVDGRLRLADDLSFNTKHPILLPKDHAVTRLVVTDTHERIGHGSGVDHTLTELRTHFWIIKGRGVVQNMCALAGVHLSQCSVFLVSSPGGGPAGQVD